MFHSTFIFLLLVYHVKGVTAAQTNQFQTPPAEGPNKVYSDNPSYEVGDSIQLAWTMNFTGAKLTIEQDNHPGDMEGGATAVILRTLMLHLLEHMACLLACLHEYTN